MKDLEKLSVQYLGYKTPESETEVKIELLGLDTALAAIMQRKAILLQSVEIKELMAGRSIPESVNDGEEPIDVEETKQEG